MMRMLVAIAMGGPGAGYVDLGSREEGMRKAGQVILETTASALGGIDGPVSRVYRQATPRARSSRRPRSTKRI